jgi:hypothetical protein
MNRRAVLAGAAVAVPAAAMGAVPAAVSPALAQLIEAHRATYEAFCKAVDDYEDDLRNPAYDIASDAEQDALFELCSYPCQSVEEASAKATYLLTTAEVLDNTLQPEHVKALLESFLLAA